MAAKKKAKKSAKKRGLSKGRRPQKIFRYAIKETRLGPNAVLYDSEGRSINVISGDKTDSVMSIRKAAEKWWPNAREK